MAIYKFSGSTPSPPSSFITYLHKGAILVYLYLHLYFHLVPLHPLQLLPRVLRMGHMNILISFLILISHQHH
jgi:hypothetical protein